jgi:hypothetical protein
VSERRDEDPSGGLLSGVRMFPELFATLNANKRSVVLDLHDDDDREHAYRLVTDADALVEGFRPGVTQRLGMGEAEVRARNPAIVYCSVSGYGQDGPLAAVPGHDLNYQAYAGMLTPAGGPPVECTVPVADLAGRGVRSDGHLRGAARASHDGSRGAGRRGDDRRPRHLDRSVHEPHRRRTRRTDGQAARVRVVPHRGR